MSADFHSGDRSWLGQQRKRFRSPLDGPGLDASGAVAHALFADQHEQAIELLIPIGTESVMVPGDPELERVLEA